MRSKTAPQPSLRRRPWPHHPTSNRCAPNKHDNKPAFPTLLDNLELQGRRKSFPPRIPRTFHETSTHSRSTATTAQCQDALLCTLHMFPSHWGALTQRQQVRPRASTTAEVGSRTHPLSPTICSPQHPPTLPFLRFQAPHVQTSPRW